MAMVKLKGFPGKIEIVVCSMAMLKINNVFMENCREIPVCSMAV